MGLMPPYGTNVFASSYAAVEQFNPQRYYAESGQTPRSLPTGTTGATSTQPAPTPLSTYIPFVIIAIVIWALERRKRGLFGGRK